MKQPLELKLELTRIISTHLNKPNPDWDSMGFEVGLLMTEVEEDQIAVMRKLRDDLLDHFTSYYNYFGRHTMETSQTKGETHGNLAGNEQQS